MDSKTYAGERLLSAWLTLSSTLWNERVVSGMTFNEAFVCNLLSHQAQEAPDQPLTATDLCERTRLLKSQMNKVLSEMEKKGYIQRLRSTRDRRQIFLRLTEAGHVYYDYLVKQRSAEEALNAALKRLRCKGRRPLMIGIPLQKSHELAACCRTFRRSTRRSRWPSGRAPRARCASGL